MAVTLDKLIGRLDDEAKSYLENAAIRCIARGGGEVLIEDLILEMLDNNGSFVNKVIEQYQLNFAEIESKISESYKIGITESASPVISKQLISLFSEAYEIALSELEQKAIGEKAILLAILLNADKYRQTNYFRVFEGIDVKHLLTLVQGQVWEEEKAPKEKGAVQEVADLEYLKRFALDLTGLAEEQKLDPVIGRDSEIEQLVDILCRRRKNNPIVVGEAGVGKTALAEGLAQYIIDNPSVALHNTRIFSLDIGTLQAGASIKGELENRLKKVISVVQNAAQPIILFIDEIHTLVGAQSGGDAANLLKPALARGELRTIGATTWTEHRKYFEKDAALARRFQPVFVAEPTIEQAIKIIRGLAPKYAQSHAVFISEEAIIAAVELSAKYIAGRQLPDKALDLLDTAAARVKQSKSQLPYRTSRYAVDMEELKQLNAQLTMDTQLGLLDASEEIVSNNSRIEELHSRYSSESELWEQQKVLVERFFAEENQRVILEALQEEQKKNGILAGCVVDEHTIAEVLCSWTGIPLGQLKTDELNSLEQIEVELSKLIVGQNYALAKIIQHLKAYNLGLEEKDTPRGVFLLTGSSGTGKTETVINLTKTLYGNINSLISINLSEYKEKHTVSRLFGAPPGYVGYGEGGQLTEPVRKRPYSVILLDEVDKAHPEILDTFYQIFDKGITFDGEGRQIDFRNTLIFMTSNLASDIIGSLMETKDLALLEREVYKELSRYLSPSFLGRLQIVPFWPLDDDVMQTIIRLKLQYLLEKTKHLNIQIHYSDKLLIFILERAKHYRTGARSIQLIIDTMVKPVLTNFIMNNLQIEGALVIDAAEEVFICSTEEETV